MYLSSKMIQTLHIPDYSDLTQYQIKKEISIAKHHCLQTIKDITSVAEAMDLKHLELRTFNQTEDGGQDMEEDNDPENTFYREIIESHGCYIEERETTQACSNNHLVSFSMSDMDQS